MTSDLLLAVLAIFLPPFPVLVKRGFSLDLVLNIVLMCLGGFPGIVHSWYIIVKYKDDGIPVVSDMLPFSGSGTSSGGNHEYQQISDNNNTFEQGASLENGQSSYNLQQGHVQSEQESGVYQEGPSSHDQQQQSGTSVAGTSSHPPPYDPSGRPEVPGDNKIQYGGQF